MKRWLLLLGITLALLTATASVPAPPVVCGWSGDVRSFAKVGDSISASPAYLHPLANLDAVQVEPARNHLWAALGYFRRASWERSSYAAQNGMTSQGLLDLERGQGVTLLQREYDAVNARTAIIMIGTNDDPAWTESQFSQRNITAIVDYTLGRGMAVILFTLPANANRDVSLLNAHIRQLAAERNLYLIDSAGVAIAEDGIHPSIAPPGLEAVLMPELYGFGQTLRNRLTLEALDSLRVRCKWY